MSLQSISPAQARRMVEEGAVLVDIREAEEHAREKIPGAHHVPLSRISPADLAPHSGRAILFHCRSGMRTAANAPRLAGTVDPSCEAYVVEGGLEGWKKAGLPVDRDNRQPIEMFRQVQIGAGSLALVGTLLGLFVSPGFFAIPAFVGAGLTFAGITGFCGMAKVLALAPWNRRSAA